MTIRKPLAPFFAVIVTLFICFNIPSAHAVETAAQQAVLIDTDTLTVLYDKGADTQMPTSSMSKVMTMYMVFDALDKKQINLDDTLLVSEKAWKKGGSKMFVKVDTKVKIEDLIRGVIIQSGNDATIVLAEGLAGSENEFARGMTAKAHELGMTSSNFMNASGWPDPDHYSTARDLAMLGYRMITDFPQYYKYYSEREFEYAGITQANRNPVLYQDIGADGIKTGHTEAAGYGLMASAVQDGRRLILVINGLESEMARKTEAVKMLRWGFAAFTQKTIATKSQVMTQAPVWLGKADTVNLITDREIIATVPRNEKDAIMSVEARFDTPIEAPIEAGQKLGTLDVTNGKGAVRSYPLYAQNSVEKAGFFSRTFQKGKLFVEQKLGGGDEF